MYPIFTHIKIYITRNEFISMDILNVIIENKEMLKILYGLIVVIICMIIVFKTDKIFRLILYKGIRYLRNAFLFYGLAFFIRYIIGGLIIFGILNQSLNVTEILLFEFFLVMAGFFLLYSLIWKRIEGIGYKYPSTLVNPRIGIFYFITLGIVYLDFVWETFHFMFFSQIAIFTIAMIISLRNFVKGSRQHRFLKFYFLAMFLSLVAWILNAISAYYYNWDKGIMINILLINIIIFLLFLYGVVKVTKRK